MHLGIFYHAEHVRQLTHHNVLFLLCLLLEDILLSQGNIVEIWMISLRGLIRGPNIILVECLSITW